MMWKKYYYCWGRWLELLLRSLAAVGGGGRRRREYYINIICFVVETKQFLSTGVYFLIVND